MVDWKKIRIKDFGRVVTGKTPPKSNSEYYNGDELFVSPKDLDFDHTYVTETRTRITDRALDRFKNLVLPRNSVMFTRASFGFGKVGIASRPCLTHQQINSVVVNSDAYDFRFVYYLLRLYRPFIFAFNTGIGTPIIPKPVFENIEVRCPPKPIQQSIAAVLTSYDDLIENNLARVATLQRTAGNIYREWFARKRFPGYESSETKTGIPAGWKLQKFGEFCRLKRGYDLPNSKVETGSYPVIASTSIKTRHSEFKVEPPVVTTGRSGTLGQVLFTTERAWPLNTTLYVHDFFGNSPYLVYYTLKSMRLENFNAGAGVPTLNRNHLNGIDIAVPGKKLQQEFESRIKGLCDARDLLLRSNELLKRTRDSLLARLISGQLSLENVDVTFPPASARGFRSKAGSVV